MKRKLQIEQLDVESFETVGEQPFKGTVYGAEQTPMYPCPVTYGCVYTHQCVRPTPSCGVRQTLAGYTCPEGCMVPQTDPLACCSMNGCTDICAGQV